LDANIKDKLYAAPIIIKLELEPTDYKITRLLEIRYISNIFWKTTKIKITKPEKILYLKIILLFEYEIINNRFFFGAESVSTKENLDSCLYNLLMTYTNQDT
jgi:hypothetical protein